MRKRKSKRDESYDNDQADEEDAVIFREQVRDLKPLYVRRDDIFTAWELNFLCELTAAAEIITFRPTVGQAYKLNQIYDERYLRRIYP